VQVAEDFEVSGCRLSSASFCGAQLVRARSSDTVIERSDLSALVLSRPAQWLYPRCPEKGPPPSEARRVSSAQVMAVALQGFGVLEVTIDD